MGGEEGEDTLQALPRDELPFKTKRVQGQWITMQDGTRLSARWWIPEQAGRDHQYPALLEIIPYRKNDFTALRDSRRHPYFAGHGYASIRVDLRGSGDSEGVILDEYLEQEQNDALEVIAWAAKQPWCNGNVGMFGKSWGGFSALQTAARQPPALKAVIAICSTDDRFATDIHYMGGCMLAADQTSWGGTMLAYNGRPPDPRHVGERWREKWLERLEETPAFLEEWLKHQTRDEYWQHGSVCEDYSAIKCPVLAVSGWADGYPDGVLRLMEGLKVPRAGIIGPWSHDYPEVATPAPNIGFLQEAVRWWDHWLAGKTSPDVPRLPRLRAFLQSSAPPAVGYERRAGRWITEPEWPLNGGEATRTTWRLGLARRRLELVSSVKERQPAAGEETVLAVPGEQGHGARAGVWCNFGSDGDYAADQREEDALALCFDSEPASETQYFLGFPDMAVSVSSDRRCALLSARLCDVAPNGRSALVSEGLLNLTHRDSHEQPTPLEPGRVYQVTVRMKSVGYSLLAGHRWRLALSSTYFPRAWPSPEPVRLSLHEGTLTLPMPSPTTMEHLEEALEAEVDGEDVAEDNRAVVEWEPAEACFLMQHVMQREGKRTKTVARDVLEHSTTITDASDDGRVMLVESVPEEGGRITGLSFERSLMLECSVKDDDPLSAKVRCEVHNEIGRLACPYTAEGVWNTRVEAAHELTCTMTEFVLESKVKALEGDKTVYERSSRTTVPRMLM